MAKVIGSVNLDRCINWQVKEEERQINKGLAEARVRAAKLTAARKATNVARIAKEKAEAEANYVPYNTQLRQELHNIMSHSKTFHYINLPKQETC